MALLSFVKPAIGHKNIISSGTIGFKDKEEAFSLVKPQLNLYIFEKMGGPTVCGPTNLSHVISLKLKLSYKGHY